MKIVKLVAENFKKLKAVEIAPAGNMIEITGKCEQGKTTILDAIQAALCGQKWDEPVREGQDKGKVVIDLGDKIVTRTFTKAGGGTLTVASKDGAKYPSPQSLLDKLVGKIAFDPLAFSREKDSKKQVEMLLKVVDVVVDPVKLQEISGVKVEIMPNPLDMLNTAYKAVYEDRAVVNRDLDKAKKALEDMPKVEKVEPVLLTELVVEKEELQKINETNKLDREMLKQAITRVEVLKTEEQLLIENIEILERELETVKNQLVVKGNEIFAAGVDKARLQVVVDALQDRDLTEINTKISNADATNKQAQQYTDYQAKLAESEKHQAEANALTAKIEAIKNYKTEIIKNTKFPVPGLDFANGGVTFDGKPFSQASSAQKMRVGIGIGMAGNPELRVIMLDGYESLDSDQRKIVEEMAQEHDFQVWTTSVSSEGVGIYIEDGEIKNLEVAE